MKVFCDACGTKYFIDDHRVAGKAFKIHCKHCDRVIVRRAPTAPVTEPVPEAGAWHVVIGDTHRPIGLAELHRLRTAGELDDTALVWREGFDDWRELGTVEELRDAARSLEVAPEATAGAAAARPVLRHERNETSVLFSLGKLASLAARPPAAAPTPASGEGSGLLDIRSIARNLAPAAGRARTERGAVDELPVDGPMMFGEPAVLVPRLQRGRDRRLLWALSASVGLLAIVTTILVVIVVRDGGSAHAAVLPPAHQLQPARPATPTPTPTPAARGDSAQPPAATVIVPAAPAGDVPPIAQATPAAAPGTHIAPAAGPRVAQTAPATAARSTTQATTQAPAADPAPARMAPAPRRASAHASPAQPVASATPPPLKPGPAADSCSLVTCIVNSYADKCCEIYREPSDTRAAPAPAPGLPESLDRAAIAAGLSRIDTRGCQDASPAHGNVSVSIKVSAAGAVTTVTLRSSPDPALADCVMATARKGSFAPTQRGGSFAYVWRF